jgi:hypothetical protein
VKKSHLNEGKSREVEKMNSKVLRNQKAYDLRLK